MSTYFSKKSVSKAASSKAGSSSKTAGRPLNFAQLAKQKGWQPEDLRFSFEMKKKDLPPNTQVVRIPPDLLQDPFKGKPAQDVDTEYNALETRFYKTLRGLAPSEGRSTQRMVGTGTARTVGR